MTPREEFNKLLADWKAAAAEIEAIQEKQGTMGERINGVFSQVIVDEHLLAPMKWKLTIPGRVVLECRYTKDDAATEFLSKLEWEYLGHHHCIELKSVPLYLDDGCMSVMFTDVKDCLDFCKEYGITPDLREVKKKLERARKEFSEANTILKNFSGVKNGSGTGQEASSGNRAQPS